MTDTTHDDLMNRLKDRLKAFYDDPRKYSPGQISEASVMALTRIGELEAKLEYWRSDSAAWWDKCEENRIAREALAEKLAKSMEALEGVRSFVRDLEPYADQGQTLVPALKKACNVLAELKGQGDE